MTGTSAQAAPGDAAPARGRAAVRVLLLGASGRLGSAIATALGAPGVGPGAAPRAPDIGRDVTVHAPSRADLALDITRPDAALARCANACAATVIVNCIAASDVDACERDPVHAHRLNTVLPEALARIARARGARLVHFSTDYVFDGTLRRPCREDDTPRPLSAYGTSKLAGERAIALAGARHWIFRVSWLYGAAQANLAARLLDPDHAGHTLALDNTRVGVPNPVQLVAHEVAHCITAHTGNDAGPEDGVYHLSSHGATTWYAFARAFLREALDAGRLAPAHLPRLQPVIEPTGSRPARRPEWSPLDPRRYEHRFGRALPRWEQAIRWALS